jgi:hypothetical protein
VPSRSSTPFEYTSDRSGQLWVGTGGGVSWYDKECFDGYTTEDELANNNVLSLLEDRSGQIWVGTWNGLSRYDGKRFVTYTAEDGLANNFVECLLEDHSGQIWIGTRNGVNRYDGKRFVTYTTEDGLANNFVECLLEDHSGQIWIGTRDGLNQYDGEQFTSYTIEDGLVDNHVTSLLEDRSGQIWIGTRDGLNQYDGERFVTYTTEDGLVENNVISLLEDHSGQIWIGTRDGLNQYDGEHPVAFTHEKGLVDNHVTSLLEDRSGQIWIGTPDGVIRWDGFVFQNLLRRDGLLSNWIQGILQDRKGDIWLATSEGLMRYHPPRTPPLVLLREVIADRDYGPIEEIRVPSSQKRITFKFLGISYRTRENQMVYVYRLKGYDADWRQTRERQVSYVNLPWGEYVFQIKAVDRDLNYSEKPVQVRVTIHPPYGQLGLIGGLGMTLVALVAVSGYALKKRRDLFVEMESELQTAHDLQMGLMPKESPRIQGLDIAGRCLPANHVGGDFFQYFPISDNRLAISLADVTGHAMEAAVPVMMFSGVLESEIKHGENLADLFASLNQTLHKTLDKRTFVCFTMGELDTSTRQFRFSNGGCPYPYHYKADSGEISELQVDAYPLGVRAEATYPVMETQLELGDRIIFCSDGIIEAENSEEEMFGFKRTAETIKKGCTQDLSAPQLLDHLISEVKTFTGDTPQGDDQTVVVLQVEP